MVPVQLDQISQAKRLIIAMIGQDTGDDLVRAIQVTEIRALACLLNVSRGQQRLIRGVGRIGRHPSLISCNALIGRIHKWRLRQRHNTKNNL